MPFTLAPSIDPTDALVMYVVYERPRDFPNTYVVRRHFTRPKGGTVAEATPWAVAPDLDAARLSLPLGLHCLTRSPGDDPVIVETWM
ncbi:MAG: hypothetical protein AAGJ38_05030 [Planctomycetota bacterium]